jgi:uncharacterized protein YcbK (DUF882 family)
VIGLPRLRSLRFEAWTTAVIVVAGLGVGSLGAYAMAPPRAPPSAPSAAAIVEARAATLAPPIARAPSPFSRLAPLRICNVNSRECLELGLYDGEGRVDESQASRIDALLRDGRRDAVDVAKLDRRVLQLVYRAAYHFRAERVDVVSAYRKPRRRHEGPHTRGVAIDFKLPGVLAATLAAYLRTLPRVGVGLYTHPRTQYVHLDAREHSYHWLDASPPQRTWRERSLHTRGLEGLDQSYTRALDWPEGMPPP